MAEVTKAAELFDLTGRTALVTGASSGLGWRFAEVLAAHGAKVAIAARRTERLDQLASGIRDAGGIAHPVALDVTDPDAIPRAFDAAEEAIGPVDILVNNAGIAAEGLALDMEATDWDRVMDTNLDAVFHVAREAARRMVDDGRGGSIVNIASILGFGVAKGLSAYAVAKAGVVQLTKAMALELATSNVRVNALAPGYILTDINRDFFSSEAGEKVIDRSIPMKRIGRPEDLDGPLLLLVSDAGRFMTGSVVTPDGGHLVRGL